jgi:glycerol-3-phosphate acyltransferase PlsY
MTRALRLLAFGAVGYLFGSVSFGRVIGARVAPDTDMADTMIALPGGAELEYRGVSATSVAVKTSPAWGIATAVLDIGKAYVPTLITMRRWPDEPYHAAVAVGAMVGHNYPLYHGFVGGRGQSPFYGSVLAMDPLAVPVTNAASVVAGVGLFRDMLATYTLGMWLTIPWFIWRRRTPETVFAVVGNVLFSIRVVPEIKDFLELRRSGELAPITSPRDFIRSYPALNPARRRGDEPSTDHPAARTD